MHLLYEKGQELYDSEKILTKITTLNGSMQTHEQKYSDEYAF